MFELTKVELEGKKKQVNYIYQEKNLKLPSAQSRDKNLS